VKISDVKSWRQRSAQTPLARFARASTQLAYFSAFIDPDGALRRFGPLARIERPEGLLPHLAVATVAVALKSPIEPVYSPEDEKLSAVRLRREGKPPLFVPISLREPYTLINYPGPGRKIFPHLSAAQVLSPSFDAAQLKGKIAILGITADGLYDQRVTPFRENEPGVFGNAASVSNILSQDYLTRPTAMVLFEMLFILGAAAVLAWVLPRIHFAGKLAVMAVAVGGYLVVNQLLFNRGIVMAVVVPTISVLNTSFLVTFLGYLTVDREKGALRGAFQHYLNASVMEQMLSNPDKLKLGGEKKEMMTVMFSDIRGFTTLSERMTPEALVKFINSYLTPMTRIVFDEGGTLDKYIGDALMAFWGAPVDQPDHAVRACRAAVRMMNELQTLKAAWRDQNLPEFDIGIGINSGPMIVGNMGSDIRFDYTVMGDSVNLASRLEGTNKEYETRLLISEATHGLAKEHIVARRLGAVRVKGKRKPVRIYELRGLGQATGAEAEAIAAFEGAVDAYTEQRFEEAAKGFQRVLELWPEDPPSKQYLEEIATFRVQPPEPGWDGVYTATTK
jgi:adenylate cyclase